jgi:glycosyltransferase involved in cell wall biosynthesis
MPKVSVIIPSYGHAKYLRACLDSVVDQTFKDWEAVVVDDQSPDGSLQIARSYEDLRIRAFENQQNLGTYATQNRCLDLASGEWVAVLNSDDYWKPEKLERQLAMLEAHPECSFSYTLGNLTEDDQTERSGLEHHADLPREPVQYLAPWLVKENRVLASSVMFRRGTARFDGSLRYSGDHVALLHLVQQGPAAFVDEPLVVWRQHETNSYKDRLKHIGEEIRIREAVLGDVERWRSASRDQELLDRNLALCAILLHSAYILCGDTERAREALAKTLEIDPANSQAKKRKAFAWLPLAVQRKRICPGVDCRPFEQAYSRDLLNTVEI